MNKKKFDLITVVGILVSLIGLGLGYYLEGGSFGALFGITSTLIIIGGTIGVTLTTMTMDEVKRVPKTMKIVFQDEEFDYDSLIKDLTEWAKISRREGITGLGNIADGIEDKFARKGIEYILEGNDYETVKELMESEIESMMERHKRGAKPYDAAGGFAPTMGIIGAVMGLVVVLGMLGHADVSELGHGIAVAFTATLLGVGFANLFCLPFAEKLKLKSEKEVLYKMIVLEGILGIATGQSPQVIQKKLYTHLPNGSLETKEKKAGE